MMVSPLNIYWDHFSKIDPHIHFNSELIRHNHKLNRGPEGRKKLIRRNISQKIVRSNLASSRLVDY